MTIYVQYTKSMIQGVSQAEIIQLREEFPQMMVRILISNTKTHIVVTINPITWEKHFKSDPQLVSDYCSSVNWALGLHVLPTPAFEKFDEVLPNTPFSAIVAEMREITSTYCPNANQRAAQLRKTIEDLRKQVENLDVLVETAETWARIHHED